MSEDIYSFNQDPWDEKGITFVLTGISYCDPNYRISRINSDVTVIEYIIDGEGTIEINGRTFHPKKGDSYLLPQGSNHTYYPDPKNPWTKIWINLSGQLLSTALSTYGLDDVVVYNNLYTKDLLDEIVNSAKNHVPHMFISTGKAVYEILYRMREYTLNLETVTDSNAKMMKDYINDHIFDTITLTDLSELINKSEQHTIRIFKKSFGFTPYQYILSKKIEYAKLYLRNSGMSVRDISYKLAFTDEFYFSNIFKKKTGVSPTEYRIQTYNNK